MAITRLEIDLEALRHNYQYLRSKLTDGVRMMAVVKAYGYGSEAQAVAIELEKLGVDYFAVAYVSEGVALRDAGVQTPILVLHPQPDNFEEMVERCLEPSIYSARMMELFSAFAKAKNQTNYPIHLKFNTGLNRLGFWESDVSWILDRLHEKNSIKVKSIFSHLVASEDKAEEEFTLNQILSFTNISKELLEGLDYVPFLHQSNTSAIINYPRAQFDCVRSGIGLYGYGNSEEETARLKPVARLKSVISQIHKIAPGESVGYNRAFKASDYMTTATIPIGHADGISRIYGNGVGYMTVQGEKAPIIGNVCMDMTMIDITGIDCKEGDEVEIFGDITGADTLAQNAGTISYELLTAVGQRVKRVVLK
ncbi:alanine racemase [Dokdonia sinensis]|uniref:Alanine racemase n=1 Tax=Dokdonia sinensis TaxID=2479847 RepID=A0A3M0GQF0_9FLAO|nr:alanine racemase [Dokdonia sinensis]RMB63409.1 alanine racemase [Dokdonia sinensis]